MSNESTDTHGHARTHRGPSWNQLAGHVRRELVRADFTERQFRIADFMVSATLERGRQAVKGIKLEELGAALGLSKGNVCEAVLELQECGVLQVDRTPVEGVSYRVLPDSAHWMTAWRYDENRFEGYLQALDVATGHVQSEFLKREPDLRAAIAETSLENAVASEQMARFSIRRGESTKSTLNQEKKLESTKSTTTTEATESVRLSMNSVKAILPTGNSVNNSPVVEGVIHRVPKLGTAPQQCGRVWERVEVPARNWANDADVMKYLNRCSRLKAELWEGKTTLAQLFCGLYAQRPEVAIEMVGSAVNLQRPNGWLNDAVLIEFGLKKAKPKCTV